MAKEKVVLAYSGGLDTSIIIPWLIENYGYEVIAVCGDVGQGKETEGLEERAKASGASKLYIALQTSTLRIIYIRQLSRAHFMRINISSVHLTQDRL